jgi:hypothetical protein
MLLTVFQENRQHLFKSYRGRHPDGTCVALALGFTTGSSHPNSRQVRLLLHGVSQFQQPDTVLEAYARADRVGSRRDNRLLSERRLEALRYLLHILGAPKDKLYTPYWQALGEDFEALMRSPNGRESAGARSVWLFVWPSLAAFKEGPSPSPANDLNLLTDFGRQLAQRN